MIFKQIPEIIAGQKTQTRRVVKAEERMAKCAQGTPLEFMQPGERWGDIRAVRYANGRTKWEVGRTYAVQSKRGAATVLHRNGSLAHQVLCGSSDGEPILLDEYKRRYGDGYKAELLADGWRSLRVELIGIHQEHLHDISEEDALAEGVSDPAEYERLWRSINTRTGTRWEDNPLVWVLTFRVVPGDGRG